MLAQDCCNWEMFAETGNRGQMTAHSIQLLRARASQDGFETIGVFRQV
jgi:hypothetical protein